MLPHHARCVLSRLRFNGHSLLLGSFLSRIGRIENPSCSACGHPSQNTSHLILRYPATTLCAAHSLATLCLSTTSGPDLEELPGFCGSMVFRHTPIPRKGSDNQQQQGKNNVKQYCSLPVCASETSLGLSITSIALDERVRKVAWGKTVELTSSVNSESEKLLRSSTRSDRFV